MTHSVSQLLELLAKTLNKPVPEEVMRCAEILEEHYVQARYPDAWLNEYRRWEAVWGYVREVVGGVA